MNTPTLDIPDLTFSITFKRKDLGDHGLGFHDFIFLRFSDGPMPVDTWDGIYHTSINLPAEKVDSIDVEGLASAASKKIRLHLIDVLTEKLKDSK